MLIGEDLLMVIIALCWWLQWEKMGENIRFTV